MDVPEIPLGEAERLIHRFGDAANIGTTVRRWREERRNDKGEPAPWSAEELAHEIGVSQSTVARIENPKPGAAGRVTIKLALEICRAFDKPLFEMLLPSAHGELLDGWSAVQQAAEALNDMRDANLRYEDLMKRVSVRLSGSSELRRSLDEWLTQSLEHREVKIRQMWEIDGGRKGDNPIYEKFAEPWRSEPTPAIVAARDALSGQTLSRAAWASQQVRVKQ